MNKEVKISASIMCANWMHLETDIRILEKEKIDYIHYDIMDGFFCPDYCLGTHIISIIRGNTNIPSDYHLMVEEPSRMFGHFTPNPGDILSIHYEACRNLHRDIMKIKHMGFKAGVILNPATPLSSVEYIIEEIDVLCIMTVNPGSSGQKLVPQALKKIELFRDWRYKNDLGFLISVDGNVSHENIPAMVTGGADILVAGSSGLFLKVRPLQESIALFRNAVKKGLDDANRTRD